MLLTTFTQNMLRSFQAFSTEASLCSTGCLCGQQVQCFAMEGDCQNQGICRNGLIERSWCFLVFLARRQIDPLPPPLSESQTYIW